MGLLDQLFRHKGTPDGAPSSPQSSEPGGDASRPGAGKGVAAIAAAIGLQSDRGMPVEFELSLGEVLQRTPEKFVWPGKHNPRRKLRVAASDIAPGLTKGRAEISLARLIALAPDVFRWETSDSDDPRVRLPLQKLLQQIGGHDPVMAPKAETGAGRDVPLESASEPDDVAHGLKRDVVNARLPSGSWTTVAPAAVPAKAAEFSARTSSAPVPAAPAAPAAPAPAPVPPAPEVRTVAREAVPEPHPGPVELRPHAGVPTSTTLRAVVLGGSAATPQGDARSLGGPVLAAQCGSASASEPPIILAPAAARPPAPAGGEPRSLQHEARQPAPAPTATNADFVALQDLFMSDVPIDLAGVASKAAALPGVHACVIHGAGGTAQAGQFPAGLEPESVRAFAEELALRITDCASRLKIGRVESTTLHRSDCAIAFFLRNGVCLSVVVDARGPVAGVRERLARATGLLAGIPADV